ncbi:uncharacterized protein [Rutidosis leptorrhynchoides]|uniref:uncharacterized protein n=1 Tax=Rutidosis leptorrhynchoides TaxID=125765 RepID=UPI003A99D2C9
MKVAQIVQDSHWTWPADWSIKFPILNSIGVPVLNDQSDRVIWVANDGSRNEFHTRLIWEDLRDTRDVVKWHHIVWFPQATPKHAFLLWVAVQKRLVTQDKLMKWYPPLSFKCVLCDQCNDSHEHLFFGCEYAKKVWDSLKHRLLFKGLPGDLNMMVNILSDYPYTKHIWNVIIRVVLVAVVYYVWQERNWRIFKAKNRSVDELVKIIVQHVQLKMLTLNVKKSPAVVRAAEIWELKWKDMSFQYEVD